MCGWNNEGHEIGNRAILPRVLAFMENVSLEYGNL
jgi:hypothetical protein